jgi:alkylated DNA repair dioxygenase AlkB
MPCTELEGGFAFYAGKLPPELMQSPEGFDALWAIHPDGFHEISMYGRSVKTPRWQQAYGEDYAYTGRVNRALPVPPSLAPLLAWSQATFDARLNGLLLNWYDAADGHYIGKHRDSTQNMVEGAPIITVSYGAARTFRLRPWRRTGVVDFETFDGSVFAMPYDTNRAFTHEVLHTASSVGRRISVTLRAFVKA